MGLVSGGLVKCLPKRERCHRGDFSVSQFGGKNVEKLDNHSIISRTIGHDRKGSSTREIPIHFQILKDLEFLASIDPSFLLFLS